MFRDADMGEPGLRRLISLIALLTVSLFVPSIAQAQCDLNGKVITLAGDECNQATRQCIYKTNSLRIIGSKILVEMRSGSNSGLVYSIGQTVDLATEQIDRDQLAGIYGTPNFGAGSRALTIASYSGGVLRLQVRVTTYSPSGELLLTHIATGLIKIASCTSCDFVEGSSTSNVRGSPPLMRVFQSHRCQIGTG
jgi:hypothetical protein